jgi:DNA-binding winged helix-turn-helix (wHTH) protein
LPIRGEGAPVTKRRKGNGVPAIRSNTPPLAGRRQKALLEINGRLVRASETQAALLLYLYEKVGRVVPYERLCLVLGYRSMNDARLHVLRQYVTWVKRTLAKHEAPYVLAVTPDLGYALCEVAHHSRDRKALARSRNGAMTTATSMRHLVHGYYSERLDDVYRSIDELIETMESIPPERRRGPAWGPHGAYARRFHQLIKRQSELLAQLQQATSIARASDPVTPD